MPARIPEALLPPSRPLTEAQKRAIAQPTTTTIPLTPQQQQELQQHEEVLAQTTADLEQAKQSLRDIEAGWQNTLKQSQITDRPIDHSMSEGYVTSRDAARQKIRHLTQIQGIAKTSLVSYQDLTGYAQRLEEQETMEYAFQRERAYSAKQKQEFKAKYGVTYSAKALGQVREAQLKAMPISDIQRYETAGYSKTESQAIAQWSAEHQQTPSPEMAKQIIRQQITTQQIIGEPVSYGIFGEPIYKILEPPPRLPEYYERPSVWETRGTYAPEKEFVKVRGEPIGFGEFTRKAIQYPADLITGLPTREREYTQEELFTPTPEIGGIPRRETVTYTPPELPPSQQIEKERILTEAVEQTLYGQEAKAGIDEIYNKYSNILKEQVEGVTSQKELNKLLDVTNKSAKKEADEMVKDLDKRYEGEFEKREHDRVVQLVTLEMSTKFWRNRISNLLRLGMYQIPFYGKALLVSDIIGIPKEAKETIKFVREYPKTLSAIGIETGATIATFGLGGFGIGKIKGARASVKIKEALKTGKAKIDSTGILKETIQIEGTKASAAGKAYLKNIIKEGGSIRRYKVRMEYPKKTKYTPDVIATYYEVMDARGNIIRRISFGEFKATLKGKTIDRISISDAWEMLSEKTGKIEGLTEVLITKEPRVAIDFITRKPGEPKVKFPKAKTYKLFYDIETLKTTKGLKGRAIVSKSATELLGIKKYKGKPLLQEYGIKVGLKGEKIRVLPEYEFFKGTGKPFTKSVFVEWQKKIKPSIVDLRETGTVDYTMKVTKGWDTFGRGVVEFVKEKPIKKTILKGWTDEPVSDVVFKYPKPKPFKGKPSIKTPTIYEGQWYGKQVLVPETYVPEYSPIFEGTIKAFTGTLPSAFAGGITKVGVIKGIGLGFVEVSKQEIEFKKEMIIEKEYEPIKIKLETKQLLFKKSKEKMQEEQIIRQELIPLQETLMKQSTLLQQNLLIGQTQMQKQKLKQVQKQVQRMKVSITPPPTFAFPGEIPAFGFGFDIPKPPEEFITGKGYYPEAYIDATKRKKAHWRRLSEKPMSEQTAMSVASEFVDKNISARGRAKASKKKKEKIIHTRDDYFGINRRKFRTWKQVKKRRTPLPKHEFIERQPYRLDMPLESKGIAKGWKKGRRTPFGF